MRAAAIAKAIDIEVAARFDGAHPYTPENVPWEPPAGVWARYSIRDTGETAREIGHNMRRETGLLWWQIFGPENEGVRELRAYADFIGAQFDNLVVGLETGNEQLTFRESELGEITREETGRLMLRCIIPFSADVFRS